MEPIGVNFDSSGLYKMYRDGDVLVTFNGNDENSLEEIARQTLILDVSFQAASEDDWSIYGVDGHTCEIHFGDSDHARIDGNIYQLVNLQGTAVDSFDSVTKPTSVLERGGPNRILGQTKLCLKPSIGRAKRVAPRRIIQHDWQLGVGEKWRTTSFKNQEQSRPSRRWSKSSVKSVPLRASWA